MRKGHTVTLNVSKGPDLTTVPDLTGMTFEEAQAALTTARLVLGSHPEAHDAKAPIGTVIKSKPLAEAKAEPGSKVNLIISSGPEMAVLNSVIGQDVGAARRSLEDAGFKVAVSEIDGIIGGPAPGTVTGMDPLGAGQELPKGTSITLTAIKQLPMITVPNLLGHQIDEAAGELYALGFQVNKDHPPFSNDRVKYQDPMGQAPFGSTITLSTQRQR